MEIYSWGGVKLLSAPTVRELSIAPSPQRVEHFYLPPPFSAQLAVRGRTQYDLFPSQLYSLATD
jgi:hypothetical protein